MRADQGYGGKAFVAEIKKRFGWTMEIVQKERRAKRAGNFCPSAGWSSALSLGSTASARSGATPEVKREHAEANLFVWMVRLMTRRLAGQASKWHNQLALNPA